MSEEHKQAHHPRGMSRLPALAQCPWFEGAEGGATASRLAAEGREAHRLLALAVKGEPCPAESPHHEAVTWAAGVLSGIAAEFDGAYSIERRVTISDTSIPCMDGVFGTLDFGMVTPRGIIIADFKTFGTGEKCHVEQLAGYAAALACEHGIGDIETCCWLYTLHGATKRADKTVMTLDDCRDMTLTILQSVERRKDGQQCANDYCRYCLHYPCQATERMAAAVAPDSLPTLAWTRDELLSNPERLPTALVLVDEFEKLVKRFKENAYEAIKNHGAHSVDKNGLEKWTLADKATGAAWEVAQSRGNRKFKDIQALFNFCSNCGMTNDAFLKCCSVNVGDITKAVSSSPFKPENDGKILDGYAVRGEVKETMRRVK